MKTPRHMRNLTSLTAALAAVVALSLPAAPASAQASCDALLSAFNAAIATSDMAKLAAVTADMAVSATCFSIDQRNGFGRKAALAHAGAAERVPDGPNAWPQRLKLLDAGERFAQPWQLMALKGEVYQEMTLPNGQKDRAAASLAYQGALADIATIRKSGLPPPEPLPTEATVAKFTKLAQQARLAAQVFVRGDILTRDPSVEQVPVPIQFIYEKTEMTSLGRQYADDTFKMLEERGRPRITLIGHTDQVGNDQYNMDLSYRRAQAIKRYLVEQGYAANAIDVTGRGKREPLPIENEGNYSKQELDQMERRVEVKLR
jgi:outer membrane protein OmpA-like peptidoglycan-associated protein